MTSLLKQFNSNPASYFAISLINEALENLSKHDKLDKGIPDIHERTIKYLIERGYCICGNKIEFRNEAYIELNKALEYLPPKSIGVTIGQFINESEIRVKTCEPLFDQISDQYKLIRAYEDEIDENRTNLTKIDKLLIGMVNVAPFQLELHRYKTELIKLDKEKDGLTKERVHLRPLVID